MNSSQHITPSVTSLESTIQPLNDTKKSSTSAIKDPWYSAIYEGTVRHRRYTPRNHEFTYRVFMVYVDLQEIHSIFSQTPWWSSHHISLAWFRRKDFFDGESAVDLYDAVANYVEKETGRRPSGAIRMLTNLRYFGFLINPITCYYCFDKTGQQLETVVAEVTNTPWGQRRHYIIDMSTDSGVTDAVVKKSAVTQGDVKASNDGSELMAKKPIAPSSSVLFDKTMHVSPFQPMDLIYGWRGKAPTEQLAIHLDVFSKNSDADGDKLDAGEGMDTIVRPSSSPVFDATLLLKRCPMTKHAMNRKIFRYPWMTVKVFAAIYWQAMKLWRKKIPFYGAPQHSADVYVNSKDKSCEQESNNASSKY